MFRMECSLASDIDPMTEEIGGFELGEIAFLNDDLRLRTQTSMIFLTLSELVSGLAEYESRKLDYRIVYTVDASSCICFARRKKSTMLIVDKADMLIDTGLLKEEIVLSAYAFCKQFYASLEEAVRHDIAYAFHKAEAIGIQKPLYFRL